MSPIAAKFVALLVAATACVLLLVPGLASAATITVTTTTDESSNDTTCSLREAVTAANTNGNAHEDACTAGQAGPATDTINLATGTYALGGASGDDANASGDLDFTAGGPLVVNGVPDGVDVPQSIISGALNDRVADLINAPSGQVNLQFQNVTLANGAVTGGNEGGGIRIGDPDAIFHLSTSRMFNNDAGGNGGAISFPNAVAGYVFDVSQTEFGNNNADEEGGAIYIDTPQDTNATVETSTFVGNAADMGGAAYIESAGATNDEPVLQFANSTLSGNSAGEGGGAVAFDFGAAGTVFFKFTTIAYNTTPTLGGGGGVFTNSADQFILFQGGTILAGNAAGGVLSNCAGPGNFQTLGFNLDSGNSCHLNTASPTFDLINTNPLIGTPQINTGGKQTTETIGLYTGSPALDYAPRTPADKCDINPFSVNEVDQRYVARPAAPAGLCDIGAFEGTLGAPQDGDSDTVNDTIDNCVLDANTSQANNDGDFQGDQCDPDDDNDAVKDGDDSCPTQAGAASNHGCPAAATQPPPTGAATLPVKKCKKKKHRSATVAKKKCKKKKR